MKKCSLYELITLLVIFSLSFFAGCSSEKIAGTSEETNEFAYQESSNSEDVSSSDSNEPEIVPSSSSVVSSSSVRGPKEISSSSKEGMPPPTTQRSSSSEGTVNEGSAKPNTLDYYLELYNLESDSFDNGVLSMKNDYNVNVRTDNPNTPPMATEFDTPWPHKIVKQNVDLLKEYFPTAEKIHSKIITAIKNETLDENCGLYSFNVFGDGLSAAFIVAEISKDTIKVLDVPAGKCEAISAKAMSRFLFYYCGELDGHPDVVHIPVETSLKNCPVYDTESEWVNTQPPAL